MEKYFSILMNELTFMMPLEKIQNFNLKIVSCILFFSLSTFEIFASMFTLMVGYSVYEFLEENRGISDENNLLTSSIFLVGSYVSVSIAVILLHVASLIVHGFAKNDSRSPRTQSKLFGSMLLMQIISTFLMTVMCFLHQHYHINTVQSIVSDALPLIGKYKDDQSVRNSLDTLQTKYHCCGFKDFRDWFLYRNLQQEGLLEGKSEIERRNDLPLTSTTRPSLPDSCCDPYTSHNLCLLSSYFEQNNTKEFRRGCTEMMQNDLGKWLKNGSKNILICLLNEVALIPLLIVYWQVFADYILLSAEIPDDFVHFPDSNLSRHNTTEEEEGGDNIESDVDKSPLMQSKHFQRANNSKPNRSHGTTIHDSMSQLNQESSGHQQPV